MRRHTLRPLRSITVLVGAAFIAAACGSSSGGVELGPAEPNGDAVVGTDEPTTTLAPADTPVSDPADGGPVVGLTSCADLPEATTDVLGDGSMDNDPVVRGVLLTYAAEHPDTFGGFWIDRNALGTLVLAFTDDPEPHRTALLERAPSLGDLQPIEPPLEIDDDRPLGERPDVVFDVVRVDHPESLLREVQSDATDIAFGLDMGINGSGADITRNRVSLSVDDGRITGDEAAHLVEQLDAAGVDVSLLCLDGEVSDRSEPEPAYQVGDTLDVITLPGPDGEFPSDTAVQCSGIAFDLGDLADTQSLDAVDRDLRRVLDEWLETGEGQFWEADGWRLLYQDDEDAQFISVTDQGVSSVGAELGPNGWIWAGAGSGGPCDVTQALPQGLSAVEWELDQSAGSPTAESTELALLATEQSCTGGSEMGERLLEPDVVETDDQILIVMAAIPLTGGQTCPGNPSTPVTIELDAPLGDREVVDGLVVAPLSELIDG